MTGNPESEKAASVAKKPTKRKPVKRKPGQSAAAVRDDAASSGSPSATSATESEKTPQQPAKKIHWVRIIGVTLLILLVAIAALFAWNRWFLYDDAADMQGDWKVASKQYTVVLDGKSMKLTNDVTYQYTIDPWAKTITYSFWGSSGHGSYRFSPDRQTLVIEENAGTDWLVALHLKKDPVLDEGQVGEGVSVLTKVSSNTAASPQSLVNQTTPSADAAGAALDAATAADGTATGGTADTGTGSAANGA